MKYKWLLFDADGTLLDFEKAERISLAEALKSQGIDADEKIISTYSEINAAIWREIERGTFERKNLNVVRFSRLAEYFGFTLDAARMGEEYFSLMSHQGHLIDGALELCRDLAQYYSLQMVTNGTDFIQHGRLDGTPLLACFSGLFISQEIGAEKPSTAFFDAVERAIPGFDRSRALVIGDSLTSDIAGGINAGIDTCWYNPKGKAAPAGIDITYTVADYAELRHLLLEDKDD
ncbi:MAG: YjjG family noncanonical pyrimidine nucleotidase [Clostridia bacterium]|nr:YjjG family noncanonical pyrimidine nucleotidase [Clostridia bacterium]